MILGSLAGMGAAGCGHSEQEWQAQLSRYEALGQQCQEHRAQLEAARTEATQLRGALHQQGLSLQSEQTRAEELQALLDAAEEQAALLERVRARFDMLRQKLRALTDMGLEVRIRHNKMVISLPGDVLFAPGSASLSKSGESVLERVTQVLASDPALAERYYQVAGHTDNQPVVRTAEEFKDNWGLSLMRAREVLLFATQAQGGKALDINRWSAAGYAATDPVATNSTAPGRRRNRRVELVVQPDVEEMLDLKSLAAEEASQP